MARRTTLVRDGEEVWETTTDGRVWVATTDIRGKVKLVSAGGKTGTRLRISSADREANQDRVIEDLDDPFTNGMLRRVDADQNADESTASDQALTTDDLMKLFAKSGMAFQSAVKKLNERNIRRMREMCEAVDASTSQVAFLDAYVAENFRKEGSMPSYKEMFTDDGRPRDE